MVSRSSLLRRKRYSEEEEYFRQILTIRQQTLGPRNPDVVQTLRHLALLFAKQMKNEDAERYFRDALALVPSDGEVISKEYELLRTDYAKFLRETGRIEEAQRYES